MGRMVLRRLLILLAMLFALSLVMFFLASLMPGDALTGQINPNASAREMQKLREAQGFYDPWYQRYGRWALAALQGDFGQSYTYRMPVARLLSEKAGNTLGLVLLTAVFCFGIGVPLGLLAGRRAGKAADRIITAASYAAMALPLVALGILCILLFAYWVPLFPPGGSISAAAARAGGLAAFFSRLHHMALPALVGAALYMPPVVQILRGDVARLKNAPFVVAARSRGLSEKQLYRRHVLRSALVPTAGMAGSVVAQTLTGLVFVETLFAYPGLGSLFVESVLQRDFTVANVLILLFAALAALGFLLGDILLMRLDPRLRIN